MPKKYIIRSFKPGDKDHKHVNPLINLSKFGISDNEDILKTSLAIGASENQEAGAQDQFYPNFYDATGTNYFNKFKDITKGTTNNYAFFDGSYSLRRQYCQQIARDNEINFILDTICNEAIVEDENGHVASLDLDKLKLFLNKSYNDTTTDTNADKLIRDCKIAFNIVYSNLGWDSNNGAWSYFKKFLIEGFIALEIIFDEERKHIIGFRDLDPVTLEPGVKMLEDGSPILIWFQNKGSVNQREIPDSNLIYISWNNIISNKANNISYVEGLTRTYNMLKQLENSHIIWNMQNSQKRMKITIPVGDMSPQRAQQRVNEVIADYTEEVSMDDMSGQVLVNGEPKFNFQKTFVFEDRGGSTIGLDEVEAQGYDMNSTEQLQYFWRKFILESQVPANRFMLNISSAPSNGMLGDSNVTREEYAFSRFIRRLQGIFKEILLKPIWVQLCLTHPELAYSNYLKQGIGIKFNEENLFTLAKKRAVIADGASAISTLMGIQDSDQKPYFNVEFAVKYYLGMSDQDIELNRKYKEGEIIKAIEMAKLQKKHAEDKVAATPKPEGGSAAESGGFGGGSNDFGSMTEPTNGGEDTGGFGI